MIGIVDYGVGNLFSLSSSLRALGLAAEITGDAQRLRQADRLILPGVGAFGDARAKLDAAGLAEVIRAEAAKSLSWASAWGCSCSLTGVLNMASTRAWALCRGMWPPPGGSGGSCPEGPPYGLEQPGCPW